MRHETAELQHFARCIEAESKISVSADTADNLSQIRCLKVKPCYKIIGL